MKKKIASNKSRGKLTPNPFTTEGAPAMTGPIYLCREFILNSANQLQESGQSHIKCDGAAWFYDPEDSERYISLELTPCFTRKTLPAVPKASIDLFFQEIKTINKDTGDQDDQ